MTILASDVTSIIIEEFPQIVADTLVRRSQLFNLFQMRPPSSPQGPRWQVKTAGNESVTSYAEGASAPSADENEYVQASLDWGQYHGTVSLGGLTRDILAEASASKIDDYLAQEFVDVAEKIVDAVETDLRGAGGSPGVVGLSTMIDDAGTFAGIDRSSATYWRSYVNDNSGTPRALTMALMDDVHLALTDTNGGDYDAILCAQTHFDQYTALTSGNGAPATPSLNVGLADRFLAAIGGHQVAYYRGRPVIPIKGYTTGRMDFVDTSKLIMRVLKGVSVKEVATSNDDASWYITWKGQTEFENPKKNGASLQDLN